MDASRRGRQRRRAPMRTTGEGRHKGGAHPGEGNTREAHHQREAPEGRGTASARRRQGTAPAGKCTNTDGCQRERVPAGRVFARRNTSTEGVARKEWRQRGETGDGEAEKEGARARNGASWKRHRGEGTPAGASMGAVGRRPGRKPAGTKTGGHVDPPGLSQPRASAGTSFPEIPIRSVGRQFYRVYSQSTLTQPMGGRVPSLVGSSCIAGRVA